MPNEHGSEQAATLRTRDRRRYLAVRAAWLYYMAGNNQNEIASRLNVSRASAQRLIASAVADGLVSFRLDHPDATCVGLGEELQRRFSLDYVEIVPGDADVDGLIGISSAAAFQLEAHLASRAPVVLAMGTGRTLQAAVGRVEPMARPQHKIVSLVGTTTRDGQASGFETSLRLADRIGARAYPLPTIVVTETVEERALYKSQRAWQLIHALADGAGLTLVGIGQVDRETDVPLLRDGFITEEERDELVDLGAVGDITGWAFDARGRLVEGGTNARVTAILQGLPLTCPRIAAAGGTNKARAIAGALLGGLVSGLITDEAAARRVLELSEA